ncbi:integral membrane protein-like protein [Sporormia fimetaria CBS 119925]|uniref:Efficient mitochondria targeting-associated protein 19 n=1 Tax=Sporormia fimetaria CBS 119925 TaxID=1340428 RepID=A0A6A6V124_9PLEO|nr:integral membrane protein-like protein [Sporormia fimetaria CBS 119925]
MATSIWTRKKDLIYLVFFLTHLPVMLAFDLTSYYPSFLKPIWMTEIRTWYISTYGDRFFYNPPSWFPLYTLLELLYHVPLTLWAIPALLRDDPRVPLALLVFALETTFTTVTCLAEMLSWKELSPAQRGLGGLGGMYGGYLALGVFMAVDCYVRLDGMVSRGRRVEGGKKRV